MPQFLARSFASFPNLSLTGPEKPAGITDRCTGTALWQKNAFRTSAGGASALYLSPCYSSTTMATNRITQNKDAQLPSTPGLSRHARKCAICRHPDREDIDEAFLRWISPQTIVTDFNLADPRALYRHAHATGIYSLRRHHFRAVLEHIIERVQDVKVTGDTIIRAIRACSCLDDQGRWHEPPKRSIVTRETIHAPAPPSDSVSAPATPSPAPQPQTTPNRHTARLEMPATSTKETTATVSNRQKTAPLPDVKIASAQLSQLPTLNI
ncbi:MAG TPA: hypothetical protein VLW83_05865 [Candidatus Acidoferrales bacterium]|nr:hypothetical protein [Candidatus Acidoferrales bacterium]